MRARDLQVQQIAHGGVRELHAFHEGAYDETAEYHDRGVVAEGDGKALGHAVERTGVDQREQTRDRREQKADGQPPQKLSEKDAENAHAEGRHFSERGKMAEAEQKPQYQQMDDQKTCIQFLDAVHVFSLWMADEAQRA